MVDNLKVILTDSDIEYIMNLDTLKCIDGLPYSIAQVFTEVIEKTQVNSDIVIKELIEHYGYSEQN